MAGTTTIALLLLLGSTFALGNVIDYYDDHESPKGSANESRKGSEARDDTCPCNLVPAKSWLAGSGHENRQWDCRDINLPEVPRVCWITNAEVTQVDLFHNEIRLITQGDFNVLENLQYLSLSNGQVSKIEEGSLSILQNLRQLDLSECHLTEVPREVGAITQLEKLDLRKNILSNVPVSLEALPNLTWLVLTYNNLKSLPNKLFGDLIGPCDVWFYDNPITDVPASTLLPLPDRSELRVNASLKIWTKDDLEMMLLLETDWTIYDKHVNSLNLNSMAHSCEEEYEKPTDFVHPCDA